MVLYTPLTDAEIFPQENDDTFLMTYNGQTVVCRETENGSVQVVQLLSTDPQHFLNQAFSPGTTIFSESIQKKTQYDILNRQ